MTPDSILAGADVLVFTPELQKPRRPRRGIVTGPGPEGKVNVSIFPDGWLDNREMPVMQRYSNQAMPVYDRFPAADLWPGFAFAVFINQCLAACLLPDGSLSLPPGVDLVCGKVARPTKVWQPINPVRSEGAEPVAPEPREAEPPAPPEDVPEPDAPLGTDEDVPEPGDPEVPAPPAKKTDAQIRAEAFRAFLDTTAWDRESANSKAGVNEQPDGIEITAGSMVVARVLYELPGEPKPGYKLLACQGAKGGMLTVRSGAQKAAEVMPMVTLAARIGRRCAGCKTRKEAAKEVDRVLKEFDAPKAAPPVLPGDDPGTPNARRVALAR